MPPTQGSETLCPCVTHPGLVSPTRSRGRLFLLEWPPKKIRLGLWEAKTRTGVGSGAPAAPAPLREGQNHARIVPGQGSATPGLCQGEQEPNANPTGRAGSLRMQTPFKFGGEDKIQGSAGILQPGKGWELSSAEGQCQGMIPAPPGAQGCPGWDRSRAAFPQSPNSTISAQTPTALPSPSPENFPGHI